MINTAQNLTRALHSTASRYPAHVRICCSVRLSKDPPFGMPPHVSGKLIANQLTMINYDIVSAEIEANISQPC